MLSTGEGGVYLNTKFRHENQDQLVFDFISKISLRLCLALSLKTSRSKQQRFETHFKDPNKIERQWHSGDELHWSAWWLAEPHGARTQTPPR